ncbi:recombinase family protein [Arthrobacter sp. StoSoilB5]|uniref:recombinase family protein n=1 Tax=Arthrobacter sp. StoSoilB5 TaxID=2830992 RepID=UPI001CC56DCF|nr:recombinase family protein [Arthrobacter sp. StoSoilB5]BCW45245.1 hypothetical protein StoSoilB5_24290 [Arthrobacter sp. StoSoilB5]
MSGLSVGVAGVDDGGGPVADSLQDERCGADEFDVAMDALGPQAPAEFVEKCADLNGGEFSTAHVVARLRSRMKTLRAASSAGVSAIVSFFMGSLRSCVTAKRVVLSLGGSTHDPTDPIGRLLFNALGMVVEFEADLIWMRTREGMAVAKAKGRLQGKPPKLSKTQRHLPTLHDAGEHTQVELFRASRTTVYRELQRARSP